MFDGFTGVLPKSQNIANLLKEFYMNRSGLIDALKEKSGLSRKNAKDVIATFFNSITETLYRAERVEIRGFGSFTVKKYKAYTGRNPKTGSQIKVSPKKLPFFKVGKELKEMADN